MVVDEQKIIQVLKELNCKPDGLPGGQLIDQAVSENSFRSRDVRSAIMTMLENGELDMAPSGNLVLRRPTTMVGV